jgi:DNA helicase-2/ATP-dependent DNA helicase PcrA
MNRTYEREPALPLIYRGPDETVRLVHHRQKSASTMDCPVYLRDLNFAQRAAAEYGVSDVGDARAAGPLLIIAGAGTGKTNTLAHRVAHLILTGTLPERILLLTFTRRAAEEMIRRAQRILAALLHGSTAGRSQPPAATFT